MEAKLVHIPNYARVGKTLFLLSCLASKSASEKKPFLLITKKGLIKIV